MTRSMAAIETGPAERGWLVVSDGVKDLDSVRRRRRAAARSASRTARHPQRTDRCGDPPARRRSCSGDRYCGVPTIVPGIVSVCGCSPRGASTARARPKSSSFTPSGVRKMFDGLRSRCTMPPAVQRVQSGEYRQARPAPPRKPAVARGRCAPRATPPPAAPSRCRPHRPARRYRRAGRCSGG